MWHKLVNTLNTSGGSSTHVSNAVFKCQGRVVFWGVHRPTVVRWPPGGAVDVDVLEVEVESGGLQRVGHQTVKQSHTWLTFNTFYLQL